MEAKPEVAGWIGIVVALEPPLDHHIAAMLAHVCEAVQRQVSGAAWPLAHGHAGRLRLTRTLTVAERDFYLQKHWGG